MSNHWLRIALAGFLLVGGGCGGPAEPTPPFAFHGQTMGTTYSVKIPVPTPGLAAEELQTDIDQCLERVDTLMSTYLPSSELSRFNAYGQDDWFPVSSETLQVALEAKRVFALTDGAFDPTVGRLVRIWNFGPGRGEPKIPDQREIEQVRASVGFQLVELRGAPPALRKLVPGVELDFSAIAKGFAVDQVCGLLQKRSITAYMVEVGGEVRAAGQKLEGTAWSIGIERPKDHQRQIGRVIPLRDAGLATSGDYRNFFQRDGRRYSHTIDPRTGRPVEHRLASVSVIAPQCMTADALATALMVMGPERGFEFASQEGLAAFFLTRGEQGFAPQETTAFGQLLNTPPR